MSDAAKSDEHVIQRTLMRAAIILAGAIAYFQTILGPLADSRQFPFVFDDQFAIMENRSILRLWPIWSALAPPPNNPCTGRPLVNFSLALNYAMSGVNTWSYHAFNLIVHILAGLGLFAVMRRLLVLPRFERRYERTAPWLAPIIALLWIVHPLCTESVTYISTRTESMMGMFFIWAMYFALRAMTAISRDARRWMIAAVICCWCSAASKEVGAMAPVIILLMDRVFVSNTFGEALRRRAFMYAGLFTVWILSAALVIFGLRGASVGFFHANAPPWEYLLTQSGVILHYVRLAFWPWPMVVDYHDWPVTQLIGEVWPYGLTVLILLGATAYGLFGARDSRARMLAFAGAWFFVILAPSSSILPLTTEIAAERRMYLPLIAIIALAVMTFHEMLGRIAAAEARAVFGGTFAALAVVALCALTIQRNDEYRTALRLWMTTVEHRPGNARARISLAITLASREVDRPREAYQEYQRALKIEPDNFLAHANLASLLIGLGQNEQAIEHGRSAVEYAPNQWITHYNYAVALGASLRPQEAEMELRKALELNPSSGDAWMLLARALADQGRNSESQDAVRQADAIAHSR